MPYPNWRCGVILAQEGDRWIVSIAGYLGSRQGNRWIVQALGVQALAIQADSAMIDGRFSA
ncbi:MAG: hypothetical protein HWQ38_11625 [Nostoc sp. NMS7]|uniref:hypothetical protein n=1 Tax=Nostoc sp. NMS7 TaxID=2815391 RepID=UPI0025F9F81A|nr:hypothetical protein [Nostoc sp. NMS7]MBN3947086.1 hypothetical protein [Nostoc sp. NMS7]